MIKDTIYREDAIKVVKNVSENYTKEGDREWHPHVDFIIQALVEVLYHPRTDRKGSGYYFLWVTLCVLYAAHITAIQSLVTIAITAVQG